MALEPGSVVTDLDPNRARALHQPQRDGLALAAPSVANGVRHDFADQELEVLHRPHRQAVHLQEDVLRAEPRPRRRAPLHDLDQLDPGVPADLTGQARGERPRSPGDPDERSPEATFLRAPERGVARDG